MDDAVYAEQLRALAFASMPGSSKKVFRWVRAENEREEGELSSDEEIDLPEFASEPVKVQQSKNRKRKFEGKKRAASQSAAPPTGVPSQNRRLAPQTARSQLLSIKPSEQQRLLEKPFLQPGSLQTNQVQLRDRRPEVQLQRSVHSNAAADLQKINTVAREGSENPFLIKFSEDDSESDEETQAEMLDADKAALPASAPSSSKPASLSDEIKRMKKQIAAIERVKGKSFPLPRSMSSAPASNQFRATTALTSRAVLNNDSQAAVTNLEALKKQIASKECEIQQQRQRKDFPSLVPVLANKGLQRITEKQQSQKEPSEIAVTGVKRGRDDIEVVEAQKRAKVATSLVTSTAAPGLDSDKVRDFPKELAVLTEPVQVAVRKSALEQLEMEEEALDKELESVQNLRHVCEIRERLARKAFREAQEALRVANATCEKLHQRRELLFLQVKAAEMKQYSKASEEDLFAVAGTASLANVILPLVPAADPEIPEQANNEMTSELEADQLKSSTVPEAEHIAPTEPACGNDMVNFQEVAETVSPLPEDTSVPIVVQADKEDIARKGNEEDGLQGSSSSAGNLRNEGAAMPGNDLEASAREPAVCEVHHSHTVEGVTLVEEVTESHIVEGVTKQGSSAGSSVDVSPEANESNRCLPKKQSSILRMPRSSAKLSEGRLVVFRQVSLKMGNSGTYETEKRNRSEAAAEGGFDYESPLKKSEVLNPFKAVCKYEHRGKCNNELCTFQHLGQDSVRTATEEVSVPKWMRFAVPVPTYRIGTYLMKDSHELPLMRLRSLRPGTGTSHSYTFLTSVSMQRPLPQDMPSIMDTRRRDKETTDSLDIDVLSCKQNFLELLSRDFGVDACLELALGILQYDINLKNSNCLKNALYVLSRALEAHQSSVSLWVVYLILFSVRDAFSKKDDMFLHAVRESKYSYELWCRLLSSRTSLGALLESYESAITALCEDGHPDIEDGQRSSCILDLVLRMLYSLVMSESSELETWIDDLVVEGEGGVVRRWKSTSRLLKTLRPSDACVLWVSSAYICAYGTLPGIFIARFGREQDLPLNLEWEATGLMMISEERRDRVRKILETGTGWLSGDLPELALGVNRIKFLISVGDLVSGSTYGQQLLQRHTCSVELVVLLASVQRLAGGPKSGLGVFQNALSNWPKEKAGSQVLWNQYAGHALDWEGDESAFLVLQSSAADGTSSKLEDSTVNRALFEALSGNAQAAQQALEKALSSSEADIHCWLEYSAFRLSGTIASRDFQSFQRTFMDVLDRCHIQSQLSSTSAPLGRGFLKSIKKRRIRCFIDNLLGPPPSDHSFLNSLLRMCFGQKLLPTDVFELKSVMHFGSALLELFPANSALAVAFCRAIHHGMKVEDSAVSASTPAWAASLLLTSLRLSTPAASEECWMESGELLQQLGLEDCRESYFKHALTIYPFSAGLWRNYIALRKRSGNGEADDVSAAKAAGLAL